MGKQNPKLNFAFLMICWITTSNATISREDAKASVLRSFEMATDDTSTTDIPDLSESAMHPIEKKIRNWSWDFSLSDNHPWTGFIFTTDLKGKINNACGATILNAKTLFTSCGCMRSYFKIYGTGVFGVHDTPNTFGLDSKTTHYPSLDLSPPPNLKWNVWHSLYKTTWDPKMFINKEKPWPWRITAGKDFKYLKRNIRCWQALLQSCPPVGTCNMTDRHEPWEVEKCEISTVAVMGITPRIRFMPQIPWPPLPTLYQETGSTFETVLNSKFWKTPEDELPFMQYSFSLSAYFLRLVNDSNFITNEVAERWYLPHSMISIDFSLCDQATCIKKYWAMYESDVQKFEESNITCMCAQDPSLLKRKTKKNNNPAEVLRLCGGEAGFPVFTARGFHGMTVSIIDCHIQPRQPLTVPSLPFHPALTKYIEAVVPELVQTKSFENQHYDVFVPGFEISRNPKGQPDEELDFYLKKLKRRSRGSHPQQHLMLTIAIYIMMSRFFLIM